MDGPPPIRDQAFALERDAFAAPEPRGRRVLTLAAVLGIHALVLFGLADLTMRQPLRDVVHEIVVRLIEEPPRPAPPAPQEPPSPPVRKAVTRQPEPLPVLTTASEARTAGAFAVAPQPPVPQAPPPIQVAPPAPMAVSPARFDADYLDNPKPAYPPVSRRLNEEGTVQLRVRVSAQGQPLEVEIRQTSGFPRLDAAAREAVARWRFVPARRGDEAVESWVGVPIIFKLDS